MLAAVPGAELTAVPAPRVAARSPESARAARRGPIFIGMDLLIFYLIVAALPLVIAFFVIYWAVRLAIRHENSRRDT